MTFVRSHEDVVRDLKALAREANAVDDYAGPDEDTADLMNQVISDTQALLIQVTELKNENNHLRAQVLPQWRDYDSSHSRSAESQNLDHRARC